MHNRIALGSQRMAAKEKAVSELDSKLFVIPENWHKPRIVKCHIRSESETVTQNN